jgi:hypothetical protein
VSAVVPLKPFDRDGDSPNPTIDKVLDKLLQKATDDKAADKLAPDVIVKIVAQAISWEKVKHRITEKDEDFDPDAE